VELGEGEEGRTAQLTGLFGGRVYECVDAFVLGLFAAGLGIHEFV
jgi:hypothetical protein